MSVVKFITYGLVITISKAIEWVRMLLKKYIPIPTIPPIELKSPLCVQILFSSGFYFKTLTLNDALTGLAGVIGSLLLNVKFTVFAADTLQVKL